MRSVGSCHDALAACEDDEQANEASPASLMFIAPTQSAGAEKPHSTHTKLLCVLRFCAAVWRHGRNQPNGSSAVAVHRSAATRIGTLAYVPCCHYDLVYVALQGIRHGRHCVFAMHVYLVF